ncbi:hypothetical protein N7537_006414 [Penicillium hordei]|uniref:protein-serine/threonine phosphatase n=1 Tax=Penicillium hordei TaxID=40994 RepID=A0AAD6H325_9EURO|nr:uncharacterized protein N7537_006414 [Penicillium hordei]KAJ5603458.1 hypothetical protein N7537_006414 [Penicillium hordei]
MGQQYSPGGNAGSEDPSNPNPPFSESTSEGTIRPIRGSIGSEIPGALNSPSVPISLSGTTAWKLMEASLSKFNRLIASNSLAKHEDEVPLESWRDELSRFHVWVRTIGDHQDGPGSLIYRLTCEPHLYSQTVRLLESFQELLADLDDTISGANPTNNPQDEESEDEEGIDSIDRFTEIQHIHKNMKETLSYLNRVSAVIPKTAKPTVLSDNQTSRSDVGPVRPVGTKPVSNAGNPQSSWSGTPSTPGTPSPPSPFLPSSMSQDLKAVNSTEQSGEVNRVPKDPLGDGPPAGTSQVAVESILVKREKQSYNLKSIEIDDIISRLLDTARLTKFDQTVRLNNFEITTICVLARELLLSEPTLLEVSAPIKVVGDIHGQYADMIRIFQKCGFPPESNYLFLGNYSGRGRQSLRTILLLLCYKIKYPENIFLLRGNYECESVCRVSSFYDECKWRYNINIWKHFIDTFNCLPIAAIVSGKIFCVHGGLSPSLLHMDDIRDIARPTDIPDYGLLTDLLWSDPASGMEEDWEPNERGVGYCFCKKVINDFSDRHGFDLVCRSHMVVEGGFEFYQGRTLVTIFSAPNYCGEFDNWGAIMSVSEDLLY